MAKRTADRRRALLREISNLAQRAVFGTLSASYRTCGKSGCRCQGDGPKHGPHYQISYRSEEGKTAGYYVPKAATDGVQEGVAAWQELQERLRELAELNKDRLLEKARGRTSR